MQCTQIWLIMHVATTAATTTTTTVMMMMMTTTAMIITVIIIVIYSHMAHHAHRTYIHVLAFIAMCSTGEDWDISNGQCSACDKNFYQNEPGQVTCLPCPAGKATETGGADSIDLCYGWYWNLIFKNSLTVEQCLVWCTMYSMRMYKVRCNTNSKLATLWMS